MPRAKIAFSLFALLTVIVFASILMAQEVSSTPVPDPAASPPQIVTDEKAGVVRVLIQGREVLVIDENGLHVQGDFSYSGTLTDRNGAADAP